MQEVGKMGWVVKMDEKGRVVIPVEVREKFGLQRGTYLILEARGNQLVLFAYDQAATEISPENGFKGFLSRK